MNETYKHIIMTQNSGKDLRPDQIMALLPTFWKTLESQGLLKDIVSKGFGYAQFVNCAQQQRLKADLMEKLNIDFNNIFRRK